MANNDRRRLFRLLGTIFAVFITILIVPKSAHAENCGSVEAGMDRILNHVISSEPLILAHRGYWGPHIGVGGVEVPENSLSGMYWANEFCSDGVEFDIKMTQDGVPMLMHDFNLGRTTNVWQAIRGGQKYDPITNTGTNPTVSSMSYASIRNLMLLSPDRTRITADKVPSLNDLFDAVLKYGFTIPMVFDTKDDSAVSAVAQRARIAFGANSPYYVAVKVNATLYPDPAQFTYGNITAIPVYTTNMLAKINVLDSIDKWVRDYGARTVEINVKQENGLLSREKRVAQDYGAKIGVFQAIPDGPRAGEFYYNNGSCCYKLSDLYVTYNGQKDTEDLRGNMAFLRAEGFGLITTDKPYDDKP